MSWARIEGLENLILTERIEGKEAQGKATCHMLNGLKQVNGGTASGGKQ